MASKSKSQLRTENTSNFPNNNTGFITPERLRTFNGDVIDSFVVNSGTGSLIETASAIADTITFTKGDGSTFDVTVSASGSAVNSLITASISDATITFTKNDASTFDLTVNNVVSASYAVTASHALNAGASNWNDITGKPSGLVSGSSQVSDLTGSLLTTASNDFSEITFTKGDGSTFLIDSTPRKVIESVINKNGFMAKGTPVYVSGSTGNALHVYAASASRADRMPATFVLNQDLNTDEEGYGILTGFINGVNTGGFGEGDNVYVGANGGYTNVKPTGSNQIQKLGNVVKSAVNGSGVISGAGRANDLPNLPNGYIWSGDSNGVPQAYASSSLNFALTNVNNTFTGNQIFNDITVNGTGSFAYIQSITGSAKIIGDAFIILNNDTPTERYAGLKVLDSGSNDTTASFVYDGLTNDWKYEYNSGSGADHNAGVVMFGPEMNDVSGAIYPSANVLQMGGGDHHLYDSILNQNGTTQIQLGTAGAPIAFPNFIVHTTTSGGSYGVVKIQDNGSGNDGGFENTTFHGPSFNERAFRLFGGGNGTSGNLILVAPDDGETDVFKTFNFQNGTTLKTLDSASFEGQTNVSGPSNFSNTVDISGNTTISGITSLQGEITASGASRFTSNITISNGASLDSNGTITTSDIIRSTAAQGFQLGSSGTPIQYPNSIIHTDTDIGGGAYGTFVIQDNGSGNNGGIEITTYHGPSFNQRAFRVVGGGNGTSGTTILAALDDGSVQYYKNSVWQSGTSVGVSGSLYASSDVNLSGTVNLTGTLTASLAEGYTWVGGAGNVSELVPTSSFGGGASGIFLQTGSYYATTNDLQVTGSFGVKGAIGGENEILSITSLTASIDLTTSNTYELTLVSSADTHLDVTTFGEDAQSVNVLVKQPTSGNTGSISFSSDFKFAGGYSYIPTPANSSEDILSFTRFGNFLYGTYLNNFS